MIQRRLVMFGLTVLAVLRWAVMPALLPRLMANMLVSSMEVTAAWTQRLATPFQALASENGLLWLG